MSRPGYTYSCPGSRIRSGQGVEGPWCDRLPCTGHRATRDQVLVAKSLAWADGHEWDDVACPQRSYLATARQVLHETGPGVQGGPPVTPRLDPHKMQTGYVAVRPEVMDSWLCLRCGASGSALNSGSAFESHWAATHAEEAPR